MVLPTTQPGTRPTPAYIQATEVRQPRSGLCANQPSSRSANVKHTSAGVDLRSSHGVEIAIHDFDVFYSIRDEGSSPP